MCNAINLEIVGSIKFVEPTVILENIELSSSFRDQSSIISTVNLSGVCSFVLLYPDR